MRYRDWAPDWLDPMQKGFWHGVLIEIRLNRLAGRSNLQTTTLTPLLEITCQWNLTKTLLNFVQADPSAFDKSDWQWNQARRKEVGFHCLAIKLPWQGTQKNQVRLISYLSRIWTWKNRIFLYIKLNLSNSRWRGAALWGLCLKPIKAFNFNAVPDSLIYNKLLAICFRPSRSK